MEKRVEHRTSTNHILAVVKNIITLFWQANIAVPSDRAKKKKKCNKVNCCSLHKHCPSVRKLFSFQAHSNKFESNIQRTYRGCKMLKTWLNLI